MRPSGERNEERTSFDAEAVTSQVQLVQSRDLAREIIKKNKLAERPEFDPVLQGFSPVKSLLALLGIGRDPLSLTPEERVLDAYYDRFTVPRCARRSAAGKRSRDHRSGCALLTCSAG